MIGNIHVGLAAIGAALAVGLIGMSASDAVGRNPGASTQILVSRFWPLPSLRRSCSTPCSWWDREKSQGAEPRAALSRNVGGRGGGTGAESICNRGA